MSTKINNAKSPIRKAHRVGTSYVLTIDPIHVKRLGIDEFTFFEEKPIANGIELSKYTLKIVEGGEKSTE